MQPAATDPLTIGELARRSGVAPSALRFYESRGLIAATRTAGGQRRYPRQVLRRVAFVQAAQRAGLTLAEVAELLASLPAGRTPTRRDWGRLSRPWQRRLDERIAELQRLRDGLTSCIGCGCLSLQRCALFNADDARAGDGAGAHWSETEPASERVAPVG